MNLWLAAGLRGAGLALVFWALVPDITMLRVAVGIAGLAIASIAHDYLKESYRSRVSGN